MTKNCYSNLNEIIVGTNVSRLHMLKTSVVVIVVAGLLCRCMLHWLSSCEQWAATSSHAGSPRHFTVSRL